MTSSLPMKCSTTELQQQVHTVLIHLGANNERVEGIEPSPPAWKAGALPLSYTRLFETELGSTRMTGQCNKFAPLTNGQLNLFSNQFQNSGIGKSQTPSHSDTYLRHRHRIESRFVPNPIAHLQRKTRFIWR